jgi:hypothetical protein
MAALPCCNLMRSRTASRSTTQGHVVTRTMVDRSVGIHASSIIYSGLKVKACILTMLQLHRRRVLGCSVDHLFFGYISKRTLRSRSCRFTQINLPEGCTEHVTLTNVDGNAAQIHTKAVGKLWATFQKAPRTALNRSLSTIPSPIKSISLAIASLRDFLF